MKNALREIYGELPGKPDHLYGEITLRDSSFGGGNHKYEEHRLYAVYGDKKLSFYVRAVIPNGEVKANVIHIETDDKIPNRHTPCEEIADLGYAIFSVSAKELNRADDKFCISRARTFRRGRMTPGDYGMLAYAAGLVRDYISYLYQDRRCAVIGHGILAEAAMLVAAVNKSISCALINGIYNTGETSSLFRDGCPTQASLEYRIGLLSEEILPRKIIFGFAEEDKPSITLPKDAMSFVRDGYSDLTRRDWQRYLKMLDELLVQYKQLCNALR